MKTLLKSVFTIAGKPFDVCLTDEEIVWTPLTKETSGANKKAYNLSTRSLQLCDVIGALIKKRKSPKKSSAPGLLLGVAVFTYHKTKDRQLCESNLTLESNNEELCQEWMTTINEILQGHSKRPKKLKVIINPHSKKGRAPNVYHNSVAQLFQRAGIRTEILVTERAGHAWEHLRTTNLSSYDGVVCVGGDGIVHEVVNGLLENAHIMAGMDIINDALPDDYDAIKPDIRIGIIPAGSTDVIAFSALGTNDPVTAAIHIILGHSQPLDTCSLEVANRLVRFSFSLAYGFLGDVLKSSEQTRWMGPKRYKWAAVKRLCKLKSYDVEINYLPSKDKESHPQNEMRCRTGCEICSRPEPTDGSATGEWQKFCGPVVGVSLITLPSPCDISPEGASPCCHLADGYTDMIIVRHCSTLQMSSHVNRNFNSKDQFDFHFIEAHRIRQCYIRGISEQEASDHGDSCHGDVKSETTDEKPAPQPRSISKGRSIGVWNVDGELLDEPSLLVRVHRQLITVFGQGIEDVTKSRGCFPTATR